LPAVNNGIFGSHFIKRGKARIFNVAGTPEAVNSYAIELEQLLGVYRPHAEELADS